MTLLRVNNLSIRSSNKTLVENISFELEAGETLALVGASGSGKTLTALSLLNLLPEGLARSGGDILLEGVNVATAKPAALLALRRHVASYIFQEPFSSLNPLMRAGKQLAEALQPGAVPNMKTRALDWLRAVGLAEAQRIYSAYPHELSGGQRQRLMVAMALAKQPKLLIADEPAAALDKIQGRHVLDLLLARQDMGLLLISHDLNQVRRHADKVLVLEAGRVVEYGAAGRIFARPKSRLIAQFNASPPPDFQDISAENEPVIFTAQDISVAFPIHGGVLRGKIGQVAALNNINFLLRGGETLGIIGQSGAGKTALAHALLRLIPCTGNILLLGQDFKKMRGAELREARKNIQLVFQDSATSLPPRLTVWDILAEGPKIQREHVIKPKLDARVFATLREVGLPDDAARRYPHEFSGGERQRIAIARAMMLRPAIMILDEPTSALDAHVQDDILALLKTLQKNHGIAYVLISHDLAVIRGLAHRVIILENGAIIESGITRHVFECPQNDYTKILLEPDRFNQSHQ